MSLYWLERYCHSTGGAGEKDTLAPSCTSHDTALATALLATWRAYSSPPIAVARTSSTTIARINRIAVRLTERPCLAVTGASGNGGGVDIRVVVVCSCGGGGPG